VLEPEKEAFMIEQPLLSAAEETTRRDGLRILARIIARHYLAHPEIYERANGSHDGGFRSSSWPESDGDIGDPNEEGKET